MVSNSILFKWLYQEAIVLCERLRYMQALQSIQREVKRREGMIQR